MEFYLFFRALQIPVSDYTYDDCRIISKAHQLNIPRASIIVEAHKLRNKLGYVVETKYMCIEKYKYISYN